MHLLDALKLNREFRHYCSYHEQAAVISAEGFARRSGRLAVALVTVGPGAANAASALPASWVDSIPVLVVAGQVRRDLIADYNNLRQFGPQEANTLAMVQPVTKYAASVRAPESIRLHVDRAMRAALSGRPGPVWLEIPLDVQGSEMDTASLITPVEDTSRHDDHRSTGGTLSQQTQRVADHLRCAKRPLMIPGNGIRSAAGMANLHALMAETGIPVITSFTGKDLVSEDHSTYFGVFGTAGQRRANFTLQNSDALLAVAAGLNLQKCGFNLDGFAPKAKKIIVDIDAHQLHQQAIKPDIAIQADAAEFLAVLLSEFRAEPLEIKPEWLAACNDWKLRYPPLTSSSGQRGEFIDMYEFMDVLSMHTRDADTIVTGNGLDAVCAYQAYRVTAGQRLLMTGWGSMGWDLPLAVGACIGSVNKRVVLITGDGSIMWNIAELQMINCYDLPIKVFIFNNNGYGSIRSTQDSFFDGRYIGANPESGVLNPNFKCLAAAFNITYTYKMDGNHDLAECIRSVLNDDRPAICEVMISPEQRIEPKASSFRRPDGSFESRPLEDMAPFLPRDEIAANMHRFDDRIEAH